MTRRSYDVLFLCTGNSARSIMAEAILARRGEGRIRAHSAGSHPTGEVQPMALEVLESQGYDVSGLRSKSWAEFESAGAPTLDFIFTVCDNAAAEACPVWPGRPVTAHWGVVDPAAVQGAEDERRRAFRRTYRELDRRIERFVALPLDSLVDSLEPARLKARLDEIGRASAPTGASMREET